MKEYVQEFWRVAEKLQYWHEQLVIYHFKEGFDKELLQACIYQGFPDQIIEWYWATTVLDIELQSCGMRGDSDARRSQEDWPAGRRVTSTVPTYPLVGPTWALIQCFGCGQQGHRATNCLAPASNPKDGHQHQPS